MENNQEDYCFLNIIYSILFIHLFYITDWGERRNKTSQTVGIKMIIKAVLEQQNGGIAPPGVQSENDFYLRFKGRINVITVKDGEIVDDQ